MSETAWSSLASPYKPIRVGYCTVFGTAPPNCPVYLKAGVAQGFALIVHELATNAVKYGALTAPTGTVSVRWSLNAGQEEPTVTFTWQERGGPPAAPPEHRGFGSLLLEKAVSSSGVPPRFEYGPEGFTYQITAVCR